MPAIEHGPAIKREPATGRSSSLVKLIAGRAGWIEWVILFLIAVLLGGGLLNSRMAEPLDALIHDAIVRATPRAPDARILIVAIDNDSVRALGRWPWPRATHAALIDRLTAGGVAAIGYDVLFIDSARDDDALAAAIARSGRVALPLLVEAPGDNGAPFRATRAVVASTVTGHVIVRADSDGVLRRAQAIERIGASSWPSLALVTARLGGSTIPATTAALIPYAGGPGTYPVVPFQTVLAGEVPPELLRGRTVLVGATAAGLGDRFATPVAGERDLMAGVETQANVIDALWAGRLRTVASNAASIGCATLALGALWAGFLFAGPRQNLAIAAGVVAAILTGAAVLLVEADLWIRPASALVVLAIMFPLWGWRRLAAASRFLDRELLRLGGSDVTAPIGGDRIARQIALLDATSTQMAMLRRHRDETLAFLSHDLRSPAAAILGLVPHRDRVADHARRLLRLADQFVQSLRAEEAPLDVEPVELAALLDEAADQCWEAAQRVGGQVTVTTSWDLPDLSVDRALMARAVVNLIDNALKYAGNSPRVHVRGWMGNKIAVVTVADTGPGLTKDQRAGLFAHFDRAGATRPDGSGLGLALVATFAHRHGGNVRCVSEPGIGALFELSIPIL